MHFYTCKSYINYLSVQKNAMKYIYIYIYIYICMYMNISIIAERALIICQYNINSPKLLYLMRATF